MAQGDFDQLMNLNPGFNDNRDADRDPTVTDDGTAGYGGMSIWINTSVADEPVVWLCLSGTPGAARWWKVGG